MVKISIIIRAYNNAEFLEKSLNSALNQDFDDYEIIFVNDGSTDDTKEVLKKFNSDKLKIIHQENKGAIASAYTGLNSSEGEFIILLDADDEFVENTLSELYNAIGDEGFSYCDYYEVDLRNGNKKYMSLNNIFNGFACGMLFRRTIIDNVGFWDKEFLMAEYDFLIRVMKRYKGIHVKKALYIYNRHSSSMTLNKEFVEKARKQIFDKYGVIEGFKEY